MIQSIRFCLQVKAPLHIGCDEVYEPTSFYLDETNHMLCPFDPLDFIKSLQQEDRSKFLEICKKGTVPSILEIYKFLHNKGKADLGIHKVSICGGLLDSYRRTLSLSLNNILKIQQELNNFAIQRTAFLSVSQRPYLPGSAIKGSLRTAYLNAMDREKPSRPPLSRDKGASRMLESALLNGGKFNTDPLRLLKVSDFHPVGEVKTRVVYAINRKKKPSKLKGFEGRGPFQIMEVILPGAVFEGRITIARPPTKDATTGPMQLETLLKAAGQFFSKEYERESQELRQIGTTALKMDTNGVPLRIGRHSGAECVTLAGYRNIRIMLGGRNWAAGQAATTLWLAAESSNPKSNDELKPFGWVTLMQLNEELWKKLDALEEKYKKERCGDSNADSLKMPISSTSATVPKKNDAVSKPTVAGPARETQNPQSLRAQRAPQVSSQLIAQAESLRPNDKIALERLLNKLDKLEDASSASAVAKIIKAKLIAAGMWKKHAHKKVLESYIQE